MQLKFLLLALTTQSAVTVALQTYTLDDGTPLDGTVDPAKVFDTLDPNINDANDKRSISPNPGGAKMLMRRDCDPNSDYPWLCQSGDRCCRRNAACCGNRNCIYPDSQNCCSDGRYCNKPDQCVKRPDGSIGCLTP